MRQPAEFSARDDGTIALSGPLTVATVGPLDQALRGLDQPVGAVDLAGVTAIDTVGAWTAWRLARDSGAEITGASAEARRLIDAVSGARADPDVRAPRAELSERVPGAVGDLVVGWWQGTLGVVGFLGQLIVALGHILRHPGAMRGKALVRQLELVGVSALGIIGLMSFLVGIVIAQQGAVQLQQFGAEVYTVNLTGRLAMRELGVLMTAIMVAGRSGSAFAAQLGTMKLTEEVDAMRTIGVSPMIVLVVPRVLASVLMMPLLGFYAAVISIIGGAAISDVALGIPFMTFLLRIQEVVPIRDLWVGMIKAPFFGAIIAMAGCYQGMQVKANAEEVGARTTMAVVQAIFMVIVLDAFFAVFFTNIGWG
ncbi:ABC transporter permease [Novosphingobium piscinae]|uniref:ABC transporter permease n=1 Tax=Novosphingobium piscinae TaxID=1507448 RepID=A0A7X1G0J4_9SPHN|nr:ABC transporter permease [Novosphingobium piscinae]MBC2670443.1 ABC transporter permease [Novosphingobium piscinae]